MTEDAPVDGLITALATDSRPTRNAAGTLAQRFTDWPARITADIRTRDSDHQKTSNAHFQPLSNGSRDL
jgi:hypothetical protein